MRRLALLLPALLAFAVFFAACGEEDTGWVIERFDVRMDIQQDGDIKVTESLVVNFNDLQRHGIFREIPVLYEWPSDDSKRRKVDIRPLSVTDFEGDSIPYSFLTYNTINIRIGDPNRLVTGRQQYRITYVADAALNRFGDHDELYWNITGNEWTVPIDEASARVVVVGAPIQRVTCFQGPVGSTERCPDASVTGSEASFSNGRGFAPGEGLTVVVALPKGAVDIAPPVLVDRVYGPEDLVGWMPAYIVAFLLSTLGMVAFIAFVWIRIGRDQRSAVYGETIVTEYEPPEGLRPAEVGLLLRERVENEHVSATIVDLAARGYLRITELENEGFFGSRDYELTLLKPPDGELQYYEQTLLGSLFNTGVIGALVNTKNPLQSILEMGIGRLLGAVNSEPGSTVKLSDLKYVFAEHLSRVKKLIYARATEQKRFIRNPERTRRWSTVAGVVFLIAGFAVAVALIPIAAGASAAWLTGARVMVVCAAFSAGMIPGGIAWIIIGRALPARGAAGRELYRRILGFEQFIEVADKSRQQFYERQGIFEQYLPYAVVFGSVDRWARVFEQLGLQIPEPSYYQGYYGATGVFALSSFTDSLNHFSGSASSTIASTPGSAGGSGFSSGGGSGGGSSGGGGGGGGGGSW